MSNHIFRTNGFPLFLFRRCYKRHDQAISTWDWSPLVVMALKTVHISKSKIEVVRGVMLGKYVTFEPPLRATFPQRPPIYNGHFFVPADSPYIDSYNGNGNGQWSVSPTAKITSRQRPVFSATDEKVKNGHEIWSVWHVDDSSRRLYFDFVSFIPLQ